MPYFTSVSMISSDFIPISPAFLGSSPAIRKTTGAEYRIKVTMPWRWMPTSAVAVAHNARWGDRSLDAFERMVDTCDG